MQQNFLFPCNYIHKDTSCFALSTKPVFYSWDGLLQRPWELFLFQASVLMDNECTYHTVNTQKPFFTEYDNSIALLDPNMDRLSYSFEGLGSASFFCLCHPF